MSQQGDNAERLAAQAADWVARLHGDAASEEDWLAHEAWLSEDASHLAAYDRAERLWAEVGDHVAELRSLLEAATAPVELSVRRKAGPSRVWVISSLAVAAAAAIALTIGGPTLFGPPTTDFRTAPGEVRRIALEDGTVIWMNGASHLQVRLGRGRREVSMELAQATFDVAKDPSRPFVIRAGADEVRVVGTEFDINRTAAELRVTVRRGIVQVQPLDRSRQPVRMTPGLQLRAPVEDAGYVVSKVDPDSAFAWREGRLVYADATLTQIAADLSRRLPVPVKVDAAVADLRFTGVLSLDDPDAVIARLEAFLPVKAHRTARAITLSSR